ncbi:Scr1 family TA system antitoxin-like transcriptional regulator [Nocardia sp. NPDC003482]
MTSGSALPRRALGRKLRALRQKADKSRLAAALAIEVSKQTIGRLEDGDPVRVSTSQYRDLLTFYDADDEARSEAMVLVEEVKAEKGNSGVYWRHYAYDESRQFLHFWSLEQAAEQVTAFKLTLLPGVLQTPDYRRWIMRTSAPDLPESNARQQLELIATRRQRLGRVL